MLCAISMERYLELSNICVVAARSQRLKNLCIEHMRSFVGEG